MHAVCQLAEMERSAAKRTRSQTEPFIARKHNCYVPQYRTKKHHRRLDVGYIGMNSRIISGLCSFIHARIEERALELGFIARSSPSALLRRCSGARGAPASRLFSAVPRAQNECRARWHPARG